MNRDDILAIDIGDSIIDLARYGDDELPVVGTGELIHTPDGRVMRPIAFKRGRDTGAALLREGDSTLRGARL